MKRFGFVVMGIAVGLYTTVILGCNNLLDKTNDSTKTDEDIVSKVCYTANKTDKFIQFLEQPESYKTSIRSARSADASYEMTNEECFAELWAEMSDDDKNFIMMHTEDMIVDMDKALGVAKDSVLGRAAMDSEVSEFEAAVEYYGL